MSRQFCTEFLAIVALVTALSGPAAPPAGAQITVPAGYLVEEVATGLNGPEGMALIGAGQIVVCEAQADEPIGSPLLRQLARVRRNGKATPLASAPGTVWVDVVHDPARGFVATQLGGGLGGVQQILHDGSLGAFLPITNLTGIALDRATQDLYVAATAGAILRIDPFGNVSIFRMSTRVDGLVIDDGILIAAVLVRVVGGVGFFNQVVAYDLVTGAETVLADNLGTRVAFLAFGREGEILVTDSADGALRRLLPDGLGGYVAEVFATGFSTSSVRFPTLSFNGVKVAPDGRIYVSDYGAGKIYVIDED